MMMTSVQVIEMWVTAFLASQIMCSATLLIMNEAFYLSFFQMKDNQPD